MENKASLMRITKDTSNKVELAKAVIKVYTTVGDISISETESTILAYFMVYGVNTKSKDLILKSGVCKNDGGLRVLMTRLRKANLMYIDDLNRKNYIVPDLRVTLNSTVGIYIKLNNNVNEY